MGKFVKGDVVVLPFPFSDLSGSKHRPALVVTHLNGDDTILCLITSQEKFDGHSVNLSTGDFYFGKLDHSPSYIRPNRLFTADERLIKRQAGKISTNKMNEVVEKIIEIIKK